MKKVDVQKIIQIIGFVPENGTEEIYYKKYPNHKNYTIRIDFIKKAIKYEDDNFSKDKNIQFGDLTTSNFVNDENFVVLECIDRLLEKGYAPEDLYLEYNWPVGRKEKGKLDILVSKNGKTYMMIECKTWEKEFKKEKENMIKNGGQLFSYYIQDKNAHYLCLYTSKIENNNIIYKNLIIKSNPIWKSLANMKEIHTHWNKNFYDNGIFEKDIIEYNIKIKTLTLNKLKDLTQEDSGIIFNQFAEILRHNIVSDKPNAFNKILNLFICKIIDEDRDPNEELKFQIFDDDSDKSLQMRLNDLYKIGMEKFLNITVSDYDDNKINTLINSNTSNCMELKKIYEDLRLKKNPEFAFKEVYDDCSFEENAVVVKEVVELLQLYKFKYNHKQQFLGNFFELLLNTSIKQEAGQFFTPVPIAKFIIRSLPLEEMIKEKLNKNDPNFLPYVIDYAAGSGHFLTEYMDEVQDILKNINDNIEQYKIGGTLKKYIRRCIEDPFSWAKEYVYGIDADYRLVKTAKVASFLNGDGEANIIRANGLDNFNKSKDFIGKLKSYSNEKDNQQFNILIANPPYSVSSFKSTVKNGKESFDLFERLTDNSSEIECLFIERMKQLLKEDGLAGIILPSTILSNSGIYSKARELIFDYFEIFGITELGSNTFMATGTNTIILFLKRRNNYFATNLKSKIKDFFINYRDLTINNISTPISKYITAVWKDISFDDYINMLKENYSKNLLNNEIFNSYQKKYKKNLLENILKIEQQKIYHFILGANQNITIINTGIKKEEKEFLGYEFSDRRGQEGIHPVKKESTIDLCTKLYDLNTSNNFKKANSYIYNSILKNPISFDSSLKDNIYHTKLNKLMVLDRDNFENKLNLKKKIIFKSSKNQYRLSYLEVKIESGNRPKGGVNQYKTGIPNLGGEHISLDGKITTKNLKFVPEKFYSNAVSGKLKDEDILICKDGALTGKIAIFKYSDLGYSNAMINEHIFILRGTEKIKQKYIYYLFHSKVGQEVLKSNITGAAQGGLNLENLNNIKIPLLSIPKQNELIKLMDKFYDDFYKLKLKLDNYKEKKIDIVDSFRGTDKRLGNLITLEYGNSFPKYERNSGILPVVGSNGIIDYSDKFLIKGPSIIVGRKGSAGKVNWIEQNCFPIDTTYFVTLKDTSLNLKILFYTLKGLALEKIANANGVPGLNRDDVYALKIKVFTDETIQKNILEKIELIEFEENKIKKELKSILLLKEQVLNEFLN